jgi:nicotinate-nucleotide--dimethylbenzimidazole phosphoribosyltransferase
VILGTSSTLAAAALVADRLAPGARRWWLAASQAPGPAVRLAYTDLALEPMLDLGLRVPGAAAIALDVLSRGIDIAGRWDSRGPDGV